MEKVTRGAILKFETRERRQAFLSRVERRRSEIASRLRLSKSVPSIVVKGGSEEETAWLREQVADFGRAFEDVKFEILR